MKVMARACGHTHLNQFNSNDITTWKREMADLTGIKYAGVGWSHPDNIVFSQPYTKPRGETSHVNPRQSSSRIRR